MSFKSIKSMFIKEKKDAKERRGFEIRGVVFSRTGDHITLRDLSSLYLVFRALDGDQLAIDLLNTAGTIVTDINRKQIWPVFPPEPINPKGK